MGMRFCISYQLTILDPSTYGFGNGRHVEKSFEVELDQLTKCKLPHFSSRHYSYNWSSFYIFELVFVVITMCFL